MFYIMTIKLSDDDDTDDTDSWYTDDEDGENVDDVISDGWN